MFYIDINNRFTAIVTDYTAKGHTINTRTMSGSQGDFAHIDLTDGTEVIRIMVDTFHEWSNISLDGLEIIVGRANSEVVPNSDNDCHALWNNELDIISRERFYEIGIDRRHRKFYGTHKQAVAAQQMKFQRYTSKNQGRQTQTITPKLKTALADTEEALREYAELEGKAEEELDPDDKLMNEIISQGRHKNLSFFAFIATPKDKTLELFGTEHEDGSFHPFHIYSMRQAIEEKFILDVLQNYMSYETCFKITKTMEENPDLPASRAAKVIRRFQELHPYNISQKSQIIVETFRETTRHKIGGRGKMIVVTSSLLIISIPVIACFSLLYFIPATHGGTRGYRYSFA